VTRLTLFAVAVAASSLLGCRAQNGDTDEARAAAETPETAARRSASIRKVQAAEYARASAQITDDTLSDHDPPVRRAAARAVSRILDARSVELLAKYLSDEDDEVVAWAAYGLGAACPLGDTRTVRALATRLAALDVQKTQEPSSGLGPLRPRDAIFDALSRCGSTAAEATLRAALTGPEAGRSGAALALGRLAARQHRLEDASVVALLDAGASSATHGALAAFGQLASIPELTVKRLVQVAERAIREAGRERTFAISALLPAGPAGVGVLTAALSDKKLSPTARSLAASTLGRIGNVGQPALREALAALVPKDAALDRHWLDETYAPLSAALVALDPPARETSDALSRLSELPLEEHTPAPVTRRLVSLRCAAASILAGTASQSTRLTQCDPDANGRAGALAVVRVLDRGELAGARRKIWEQYLHSPLAGVRRAALALLPRHLEAAPVVDELVRALSATEPGVVAQAARVLADAPRLADAHPPGRGGKTEKAADAPETTAANATEPSRAIVDALAKAMDAERPADQIEARVALASAAAGVGALSLKARLERYCESDNVTLRRGAESALRSLGAGGTSCDKARATPAVAPPSDGTRSMTLTFVTDAGRLGLTLDPGFAPLATARIVELARKGFYDGMPILRVSPGYIVQLGDSTGDGSGGAGGPPLPSEGAPAEFGALSVGLALGGRDTGSSQLFVTLAEEPPFFGDYPLLGSADPDWATVAEGDRILRVELHE
jgi:cyclophilin family peptidyl-prolyl cis-trans isomerase/HEAT repeat protein